MTQLSIVNNHQDRQDDIPRFMNVRQVADYLHLNEKKVYALVSEGKIPGTKITGKWMFPRTLIDQWLLESSHGGVFTDRLIISGSDDPLLQHVVRESGQRVRSHALISYSATGTQLGLELLAQHRVDACAIHWGPLQESHFRHPALLKQFPHYHNWTLVRLFSREQGFILHPRWLDGGELHAKDILTMPELRWCMRQQGAGSQRFLQDLLQSQRIDTDQLLQTRIALSENDAASCIAMQQADVAPGIRSIANQYGLAFIPVGWEAFDLVLNKNTDFRTLLQNLLKDLASERISSLAEELGGYDYTELGKLVNTE